MSIINAETGQIKICITGTDGTAFTAVDNVVSFDPGTYSRGAVARHVMGAGGLVTRPSKKPDFGQAKLEFIYDPASTTQAFLIGAAYAGLDGTAWVNGQIKIQDLDEAGDGYGTKAWVQDVSKQNVGRDENEIHYTVTLKVNDEWEAVA